MTLSCVLGSLVPHRAVAQRRRTQLGRSIERNDSHARFYLAKTACRSLRCAAGKIHCCDRFGSRMDTVVITALDQEGRGIARREGKVAFVEGALIGERVAIELLREKPNYSLARLAALHEASPARVKPACQYFGTCGGCSLQHLDPTAQVAIKQRVLEDALWHIGRVRAGEMLSPIQGTPWEYRHRARFSVRNVPRKGGVLVGFHERKSSFVADMKSCLVVPERISALLPELRALIERLSIRDRVPQIELAIGEGAPGGEPLDALVLRVLAPPSEADLRTLSAFESGHRV